MNSDKHMLPLTIAFLVILQSACLGKSQSNVPDVGQGKHDRSTLLAKLGLEAPADVYAFIKCKGGVESLPQILPDRSVCEIALEYRDSVIITCTSYVYEFDGSDSLVNVGVSSDLEALFLTSGGIFSFVESTGGGYSFLIDAERQLDTIPCPR